MKKKMSLLVAVLSLCFGFASAGEYDYTRLPDHPRLLLHEGGEAVVWDMLKSNPKMMAIHERIIQDCDQMLNTLPSERVMEGKRLLTVSRIVLERVFYLSYGYRMTGKMEYLKRAEQEMLSASAFTDWNPKHFLDVGEMCFGLAIGYDWLYDDLSEQTRRTIREAIVEKGLMAAKSKEARFYRSKTNWNQVCNGGLVNAALAICEDEPELAKEIVDKALGTIGLALQNYAPDGGYPEGFQYWTYGTAYQVLLNDALEQVFGHASGLNESPGLLRSARYVQFMTAPTGDCFCFSDANPKAYGNIMMFWFAQKADDPSLLWLEMDYLKDASLDFGEYNEDRFLPCIPIFASRVDLSKVSEPEEYVWKNEGINPLFIYRSGWSDRNDVYLGVKGGIASFSHAHMDAGSFMYETAGVRWAMDLGMQNYYSLESKGVDLWNMTQDSQRWDVYRIGPAAHNTLTVGGGRHMIDGKADFTAFYDKRNKKGVEVDLTSVLGSAVGKAVRSVVLQRDDLIVTDALVGGKQDSNIRWTMCTPADAEIIGDRTFILRKDGKTMEVAVDAPCKVGLFIKDNVSENAFDYPNPGTCRIGYNLVLESGKNVVVKVTMTLK